MGQASLATFYVVFAILTIYLNLESIGTWDANAIFRTVSATIMEQQMELQQVQDPAQVYLWAQKSLKPVLFGEQEAMSMWSAWGNMSWTYSMTPATIGHFNRILLVRFSFKHWSLESTIGQFQSQAPRRFTGGFSRLDPFVNNDAELQSPLCPPGVSTSSSSCFTWGTSESFDKVGGYTSFFDPMEGQQAYDSFLNSMQQAGLFDIAMGSCTIDMIVYNANVEMFLQYVQSFSFDFSGHVQIQNDARSFNLNVFNTSVGQYLLFYIMRVTCVVMLVIFLLIEFRRIWDLGFFAHFQQQGSITDMVSITVSLGVFFSYWIIEQMPPFNNFQFSELQNPRPTRYLLDLFLGPFGARVTVEASRKAEECEHKSKRLCVAVRCGRCATGSRRVYCFEPLGGESSHCEPGIWPAQQSWPDSQGDQCLCAQLCSLYAPLRSPTDWLRAHELLRLRPRIYGYERCRPLHLQELLDAKWRHDLRRSLKSRQHSRANLLLLLLHPILPRLDQHLRDLIDEWLRRR